VIAMARNVPLLICETACGVELNAICV